jgi:hypothetical protein
MKTLSFLKKIFCSCLILFFLLHLTSVSGVFSSCSKAEKRTELFPEIKEWKKSEEIQTYTPENLYEYINGAAELYLIYDFQELQASEYTSENEASIVIEIYYHKTPEHAFGIYSQERPTEGNFVDIGTQGYIAVPIVNFVAGNTYVKINSYNVGNKSEKVLQTFANRVAENIGDKGPLPKILNCFPEEGKKKNG